MSFSGDLEHLPIVDVIQLLHATRKSGVLRVTCRKGESQLVFKDGYMVSANHLNSAVRIGKILSDLNMITPEILDQALQEQAAAGSGRKPLVITLIEKGYVKEEDAYKGLERLIEMTIVEILTWKKGTFTLDVLPPNVSDEYRFYPDKMNLEVTVDTQSMLMDALRIYDEKMRDGQLTEECSDEGEGQDESLLCADDLGLGELDQLERKIPEIFKSLQEADAAKAHREAVREGLPELSPEEQEGLISFLQACASEGGDGNRAASIDQARCLILFSSDEFLGHAVTTICSAAGIGVLTTSDEENLIPVILQSLARNSLPVLLLDRQGTNPRLSTQNLSRLRRQMRDSYPELPVIQLAAAQECTLGLQAYGEGAAAVFPCPLREESPAAAAILEFLKSLRAFLPRHYRSRLGQPMGKLKESCGGLREIRDSHEVARALLEGVAKIFERAVILIVRRGELVAERSIGVAASSGREPVAAPGLRVPLAGDSLPCSIVEKGHIHFGAADDAVTRHVFDAIGAPLRSVILLLPLKNRGRTVALAYADFGGSEIAPVDMDLLEILAGQAELALDNALYRRKYEKG